MRSAAISFITGVLLSLSGPSLEPVLSKESVWIEIDALTGAEHWVWHEAEHARVDGSGRPSFTNNALLSNFGRTGADNCVTGPWITSVKWQKCPAIASWNVYDEPINGSRKFEDFVEVCETIRAADPNRMLTAVF